MKLSHLFLIFLMTLTVISCKKDKDEDQTVEKKILGLWHEASQSDYSLNFTNDPDGDIRNLFLFIGQKGYPFHYEFNSTKDSLVITREDVTGTYKFTLEGNSLIIQNFSPLLPAKDPVTFTR